MHLRTAAEDAEQLRVRESPPEQADPARSAGARREVRRFLGSLNFSAVIFSSVSSFFIWGRPGLVKKQVCV